MQGIRMDEGLQNGLAVYFWITALEKRQHVEGRAGKRNIEPREGCSVVWKDATEYRQGVKGQAARRVSEK